MCGSRDKKDCGKNEIPPLQILFFWYNILVAVLWSEIEYGLVAQLGERRVRNAEVEGSIPFESTNLH